MSGIPTEFYMLFVWALLGGVGGISAARRRGLTSLNDAVTHAVNMGGASVVVCAVLWWWFDEHNPKFEILLYGVALGVGLLGLPVLEWAIERGKYSAEKWVKSKEPKDSESEEPENDQSE